MPRAGRGGQRDLLFALRKALTQQLERRLPQHPSASAHRVCMPVEHKFAAFTDRAPQQAAAHTAPAPAALRSNREN